MSQNWVDNDEGAGGTKAKQGFINLEQKLDTLRSNWEGTTHPTVGLVNGQTSFRSDLSQLYLRVSAAWKKIPVEGTTTFDASWLASDAVTTVKILDANVTAAKIASDAVTTAKILDANVTAAKLATDSVTTAKIAALAVTAAKIANATITATQLASDCVITAKILDANVTAAKLASNSVTTAKVADDAITIAKMGAASSAGIVFGTAAGSTDVIEIPRTELVNAFSGRKVTALQEGSLNSHGLAVLCEDGGIMTMGLTDRISPDYTGARTYNYGWRPLAFNAEPAAISKVVTNGLSGYALDANGDVWSWGDNSFGQLGHGDTTDRPIAEKISGLDALTITDIFCSHTYHETTNGAVNTANVWFITDAGHVYGCGQNRRGELGDSSTTQRTSPVRAGTITGITNVVSGEGGVNCSVMALKSDGTVYSWGANGVGQLGQGDTTDRTAPTVVSGLTGIDYIQMLGGYETLNVTHNTTSFAADGATLESCGDNGHGQLGDNSTTDRSSFVTPTIPGTPGSVAEIDGSAGYGFTIMRDTNGKLYSTGRNAQGQLGLSDTTDRDEFVEVTMPSGVTATKVACGNLMGDSGTTVFLGSDGALYGCGNNPDGLLSQNDQTDLNDFTRFKMPANLTISDFRFIGSTRATGNSSGLIALTDTGELLGCGTLGTVGLPYPSMPGDTAVRATYVLTPIPVLI